MPIFSTPFSHWILNPTPNYKLSPTIVDGFNTPSCLDYNSSGGCIMLFVWEDILAKLIGSEKPPVEGFYVEMNLRNQK